VTEKFPFPKSILELGQMFSSDDHCLEYLFQARFLDGFICSVCQSDKGYPVPERKAIKCGKCASWTYLTEGTVMEKSKTSPCKWFSGAYLMVTVTPGISATQFQRQLDIPSYECAFQILHKLRAAMIAPTRELLKGVVEVDETMIGGHRIGARGRGAEGKALVIGAVEKISTSSGSRAGRVRLQYVSDASAKTIKKFLTEFVEPGTVVRTDGWSGYNSIDHDGYEHHVAAVGEPENASKVLPQIHRVFGNLKAWIIGTFHGVSPKHMQAYLNEYTFRFNRRKNPWKAFDTILGLATHSDAPTYDELYKSGSESGWEHPH
jgi:transposase-like protein